MTPDRWQLVQAVFEQAVACEAEARADVLANACAQDEELRAEVESLLAHHQAADPAFMRPREWVNEPFAEGSNLLDRIGQHIGRYTITDVVSRGGMGVVYAAMQDRPHRTVALKIMRTGLTSRSAMKRFNFEAELLARLQHPNIAQIHEAGIHEEHEGISGPPCQVPYFAMEYIAGARALTEYAESHNLTTRQRLSIFIEACDGVHHGHQKGVIHRDLKPSNILVTGDGHVKIIDFGVSKCTDADLAVTTVQTFPGELVGTLAYMSPEQCEGKTDLDTRSDVYALGVVLYELLCGRLPYDLNHTSWVGKARMICEQPPTPPTQIDKKLRGDLEAIVLKALEKNRDRRYASAAALGDDLRRFLAGEPVSARTATRWNRMARWAACHPRWSTVMACSLIALGSIIPTGVTLVLARFKPAKVEQSEDRSRAWLKTAVGYTLHEWMVNPPATITNAKLVEIPKPISGVGPAVLLSYSNSDPFGQMHGLIAYPAVGEYDEPIWSRMVERSEMPQLFLDEGFLPESGATRILLLADIFPESESPGQEIVASHSFGGGTLTVFRVYALDGKPLYQFCHDGMTNNEFGKGCYWMADVGLLIFIGLNCEVYAKDRGATSAKIEHVPVIYAVKPEYGVIHREFLATTDGFGKITPEWYFAVEPMELLPAQTYLTLSSPYRGSDPSRFVLLDICMRLDGGDDACFGWELDHSGTIQPNSLRPNNLYATNKDKLPPMKDFRLAPLRPTLSATSTSKNDG